MGFDKLSPRKPESVRLTEVSFSRCERDLQTAPPQEDADGVYCIAGPPTEPNDLSTGRRCIVIEAISPFSTQQRRLLFIGPDADRCYLRAIPSANAGNKLVRGHIENMTFAAGATM